MFCTECGTKLDDGVAFCTNCGHKMESFAAAASVAQAATPVAEPVSQSMYSEPASQSMYSEPASQSMYSEPASQSMYSQPASQSMYSQSAGQGMYGGADAGQSMYGGAATQNTYGAPNQMNASYNYAGTVPQQPKKKGKGCLIAALIGGGILLLLIIVVVVAIIAGVAAFSGNVDSGSTDYSYEYDYDDYDDYSYDYDDYSYEYDNSDDDSYDDAGTTTSNGTYDIDDITGSWTGTSSLVEVSGASEMQSYLEDLYGRSLSADEIAGLSTATATDDYLEVEIYEYYDEEEYSYYAGSWQIDLDMGDFFGTEIWDDWDAITYDQYMNGQRDAGCIELDENNCFYIEVMEKDYIGEYGAQFFDVDDTEVEEDGAYGLVFAGQVSEGSYGPQIDGEIIIMFQYGDMAEPYMMRYEYTLDDLSY